MALTMFLVLGGYYLLKTAREIFILSEGGAEVKSYSSAGQALLLLLIVPAYSAFASRVNRTQLVQLGDVVLRRQPRAVPAGAGRRAAHRHRVLPLARHLQRRGDRAALGVCRRPLHRGAGQAAVSADRRRQQPGRVGRLDARQPARGAGRGAAAPRRRGVDPGRLRGAGAGDRPLQPARGGDAGRGRADEKLAARPERLQDDLRRSVSAADRGTRPAC